MAFIFFQLSDGVSTHEWSMGTSHAPLFDRRSQPLSPSIRERILHGQAFPALTSPWFVPQVADVSPRPASSKAQASIRRSVVTGSETLPDCAICIDVIQKGDRVAVMPCGGQHCFHDRCLSEWLRSRNTCPICRHTLDADDPASAAPDALQDALDESRMGWIRYTDFHLAEPRIPMAQAIPVAEPAAWGGGAAAVPVAAPQPPWDGLWGVGMGVGITERHGIVVTELVPGGPAHRSGQIARGDTIVAVDDNPLEGASIPQVLSLVLGPRGTAVRITLVSRGNNFLLASVLPALGIRHQVDVTLLRLQRPPPPQVQAM